MDRGRYDHLTYDQIHELRRRQGSKAALHTQFASMGAEARKRALTEGDAMDTSAFVTGKRDRAPVDVVGNLDGPSRHQEKMIVSRE